MVKWKLLRNFLKKQAPSTSNKKNPEKARATELLKNIGIINERKQQTDFLQSIDSFCGGFGNFESDLISVTIKNSN